MRLGFPLILWFLSHSVNAATWYADPNASISGSGSIINPWPLQMALTNPAAAIQPGDTVWMRGGTYGVGSNIYPCSLLGTSNGPIVVRQFLGERAIINGGIDATSGGWTTFWGFEITCSNERTNLYANRPAGLIMNGIGHKAVNLVIHDTGHPGIATYQEQGNGREIYGCVIWGVGIYDYDFITYWPTNPFIRGAGIYAQNRSNSFLISDTISSRNFTYGMKAYAESGFTSGFIFDGNVEFLNDFAGMEAECLYNSITNCTMRNNQVYLCPKVIGGTFSDDAFAQHHGLVCSNNYLVGNTAIHDAALWIKRWQDVKVVQNTFVTVSLTNEWSPGSGIGTGRAGKFLELYPGTNAVLNYTINSNAYFGGVEQDADWASSTAPDFQKYQPFRYLDYTNVFSFGRWTNTYGFDVASTYTTNFPATNFVVLRTNKYELGRAHVVVFNWASNSTATVNISTLGFTNGQHFEVRDVQNYLGTPTFTGVFLSASPTVTLSLTQTNVTAPTGDMVHFVEDPKVHTASLFNAFVVIGGVDPYPDIPTVTSTPRLLGGGLKIKL